MMMITVVGFAVFNGATALVTDKTQFMLCQFLARLFLTAEYSLAVIMAGEEFPARHRGRAIAILTSLAIWPVTVLVGMILRRALFDDGTAVSFVVVATLFLGAFLVGWRAVWRVVDQRRRQSSGGALTVK